MVYASDFPSKKAKMRNRGKRDGEHAFFSACDSPLFVVRNSIARIVTTDASATEEKGKHECQFHGTIIKCCLKNKKKKIFAHANKL